MNDEIEFTFVVNGEKATIPAIVNDRGLYVSWSGIEKILPEILRKNHFLLSISSEKDYFREYREEMEQREREAWEQEGKKLAQKIKLFEEKKAQEAQLICQKEEQKKQLICQKEEQKKQLICQKEEQEKQPICQKEEQEKQLVEYQKYYEQKLQEAEEKRDALSSFQGDIFDFTNLVFEATDWLENFEKDFDSFFSGKSFQGRISRPLLSKIVIILNVKMWARYGFDTIAQMAETKVLQGEQIATKSLCLLDSLPLPEINTMREKMNTLQKKIEPLLIYGQKILDRFEEKWMDTIYPGKPTLRGHLLALRMRAEELKNSVL
jgi:hypothetical protein